MLHATRAFLAGGGLYVVGISLVALTLVVLADGGPLSGLAWIAPGTALAACGAAAVALYHGFIDPAELG